MKRAALYMRVSTKGHGQTTETQAVALREYAAHRGFLIIGEYRDEGISGSKDSRPALDRLMKDDRARKLDVVIVSGLIGSPGVSVTCYGRLRSSVT